MNDNKSTRFKKFEGKYIEQIPKIFRQNLAPASIADVMELRLTSDQFYMSLPFGGSGSWFYKEEDKFLIDNRFTTSDLILQDSKYQEEEFKLIFTTNNQNQITENGKKVLETISKNGHLVSNSGINLVEDYNSFNGEGIIKIPKKFNENGYLFLKDKEIFNNKIFRILARHPDEVPEKFAKDENLLKEYVKFLQFSNTSPKKSQEFGFSGGVMIRYGSRIQFLSLDSSFPKGHTPFIRSYGRFLEKERVLLGLEKKDSLEYISGIK